MSVYGDCSLMCITILPVTNSRNLQSCVPSCSILRGRIKTPVKYKTLQDTRPSSYFILVTSGHILSLRLRSFSSPGAQFEGVSTANIRCCRATYESHCDCPSCKAYVKSF